ncbi:hypothetical protein PAXRUDRAFT_149840, partial [Paxillus rubicundulus Ve08.2h10]
TGHYVLPPKALCGFSNKHWGYATNEVMESVDLLSAKKWDKILAATQEYVGAHQPQQSMDNIIAQLHRPSGRAKVFEPDSD